MVVDKNNHRVWIRCSIYLIVLAKIHIMLKGRLRARTKIIWKWFCMIIFEAICGILQNSPMTALLFTDGRSSPMLTPFRKLWTRHYLPSSGKRSKRLVAAEPTPESTPGSSSPTSTLRRNIISTTSLVGDFLIA